MPVSQWRNVTRINDDQDRLAIHVDESGHVTVHGLTEEEYEKIPGEIDESNGTVWKRYAGICFIKG